MTIYCKGCQHFRGGYCHSPNNDISPVTGLPEPRLAALARLNHYECKASAANFEPKKSLLQRLFK